MINETLIVHFIQEGDMLSQAQDTLTFILPAPMITRQQTGILWYEVTVMEGEARCTMAAFHETTRAKVSEGEGSFDGGSRVRMVLKEGDAVLTGEMVPNKEVDGETRLQFLLNGYEVDVEAMAGDTENAMAGPAIQLSEAEKKLGAHWGRMGESILTMGQIAAAKSPADRSGFSTAQCAVIGVGTTLAAVGCVAGVLTADLPLVAGACALTGFGGKVLVEGCL
jgi:hypothetical protein